MVIVDNKLNRTLELIDRLIATRNNDSKTNKIYAKSVYDLNEDFTIFQN